MEAKFIRSFVVDSFGKKTTIISFNYLHRNYILTCKHLVNVDSSFNGIDLLVCVNYLGCDGYICPFFSLYFSESMIANKESIKLLVVEVCKHIDDKYNE